METDATAYWADEVCEVRMVPWAPSDGFGRERGRTHQTGLKRSAGTMSDGLGRGAAAPPERGGPGVLGGGRGGLTGGRRRGGAWDFDLGLAVWAYQLRRYGPRAEWMALAISCWPLPTG